VDDAFRLTITDAFRLTITNESSDDEIRSAVHDWVEGNVAQTWRDAAANGRQAIRAVRTRHAYEAWYPTFAASGLAVATWPRRYGGLDLTAHGARAAEEILAPLNLGRLNPLGLHNAAPALFAHGTEQQRLRFLPPMVANEQRWCQLFSEPGAGSDLASLATRAERDGDEWILSGQKVWSTWAHHSDYAICLARTDPSAPKRQGITYFLVNLHAPGVDVRPLRHIGGLVDFNEVWLDEVRVPDVDRVGGTGDGWRVAASTLAGERQMVAGSGSGGVDRIGGGGVDGVIATASASGVPAVTGDRLMHLYAHERVRQWTNDRVRANVSAGGTPGPAASIGKVHQGQLNQAIQLAAIDLLGAGAMAWPAETHDVVRADGQAWCDPHVNRGPDAWAATMPYDVQGMLRSRANTIEGGTTEVNKNVIGEKVLGLPREPDPYRDRAWNEIPR
jgi:alkylation response protein AidB-like acyl-CoA dehydrogenase